MAKRLPFAHSHRFVPLFPARVIHYRGFGGGVLPNRSFVSSPSSSSIYGGKLPKRPGYSMSASGFSSKTGMASASTVSIEEGLSGHSPLLLLPRGLVVNPDYYSDSGSDYYYKLDTKAKRGETGEDYYHLYNVAENKISRVRKNLRLPWQREPLLPNQEICLGSSYGWLAFIHPCNCSLYLYNPFVDASSRGFPYLPLPPIETLSQVISGYRSVSDSGQIKMNYECGSSKRKLVPSSELSEKFGKIVLSSSPSPFPFQLPFDPTNHHHQQNYQSFGCAQEEENNDHNNCMAMAIIGDKSRGRLVNPTLICCKIGDLAWTKLLEYQYDQDFKDIVYLRKQQMFYVIDHDYQIWAWDLKDMNSLKETSIKRYGPTKKQDEEEFDHIKTKYYLVESLSGDLLMVKRRYIYRADEENVECCYTYDFDVHKLNFQGKQWEHVPSLGDQILFVGINQSFSVSSLQFPGLKPNSIYFSSLDRFAKWEFELHQTHDVGIFDMECKTVTPLYHCPQNVNLRPRPIWVMP